MKKIIILVLIVFINMFFTNCSGIKYIKFSEANKEIYSSSNLKTFLKDHKNPKVVLRVPSNRSEVTESETKSYLYDAIEKELLKKGFVVRDRQLFSQVLSNTDNKADYSQLREKTDTDLIIELSKLNTEVLYETNKYTTNKGKNGVLDYVYKRYGAEVEFKIIMMKNNEFAGTYTFNYSPCSAEHPCVIDNNFTSNWRQIQKGKKEFEQIEKDQLSEFMRRATQELVNNMRE